MMLTSSFRFENTPQKHVLESDEHVVKLRKIVRDLALEIKLTLVDQTKLITAASELARNTLKYGGGGEVLITMNDSPSNCFIKLEFIDQGPGIQDLAEALTDGFTTGNGLGLGLSGSKRLVDEFAIVSAPGQGTKVTIIKRKLT